MNGFGSSISPSQQSNNSVSFARDYTGVASIAFNSVPPIRNFLQCTDAAFIAASNGSYISETLTLQNTNINKLFQCARSVAFTYRPWYSGNDYYIPGVAFNRFKFVPSVILYNHRTNQTLHIKPQSLKIENATVGGVTGSYLPRNIIVQGVTPFYFDLNDTVEVFAYLTGSAGGTFGKLNLNFFNFDMPPFFSTNVDELTALTIL